MPVLRIWWSPRWWRYSQKFYFCIRENPPFDFIFSHVSPIHTFTHTHTVSFRIHLMLTFLQCIFTACCLLSSPCLVLVLHQVSSKSSSACKKLVATWHEVHCTLIVKPILVILLDDVSNQLNAKQNSSWLCGATVLCLQCDSLLNSVFVRGVRILPSYKT